MAAVRSPITDVGAAIASGSFRTMGMIVAPCSVRTLSEIASGVSSNLLTRAADVVTSRSGAVSSCCSGRPRCTPGISAACSRPPRRARIVMPPVPAFYGRPRWIDELVTATVCRALDLFDLDVGRLRRWGEDIPTRPAPRRDDEC